jgi:hypothetical protein
MLDVCELFVKSLFRNMDLWQRAMMVYSHSPGNGASEGMDACYPEYFNGQGNAVGVGIYDRPGGGYNLIGRSNELIRVTEVSLVPESESRGYVAGRRGFGFGDGQAWKIGLIRFRSIPLRWRGIGGLRP